MTEYTFGVTVTAESAEQAAEVMRERIDFEEDYGFEYEVEYALYPFMIDGEYTEVE